MTEGIQEAVLYGLMNYGERTFVENRDQLHADLFTGPNRLIFETIEARHKDGRPIDHLAIAEALPACDRVQELMLAYVGRGSLPAYIAELNRAHATLREAVLGEALLRGEKDREEVIRELRELDGRLNGSEVRNISKSIGAWVEGIEQGIENPNPGLRTGWPDLDTRLGGLLPGNLTIIAARPSMGKTAAAVNIAAKQDKPVLFFSLEMSEQEVLNRLVSMHGVDHGHLRDPRNLTDQDWPGITKAMTEINERSILINDAGGTSIAGIEAMAQRTKGTTGLGLIVIDYLQLVTCKSESRLQEVSEVSRRLKALAKNLAVPIIALCQLNRGCENRLNPVPNLSDLRESGQIEQDADQVIFIHRPEVFEEGERPGEAEFWIKKNRHGESGCITLGWHGRYQRFVSLTSNPYRNVA